MEPVEYNEDFKILISKLFLDRNNSKVMNMIEIITKFTNRDISYDIMEYLMSNEIEDNLLKPEIINYLIKEIDTILIEHGIKLELEELSLEPSYSIITTLDTLTDIEYDRYVVTILTNEELSSIEKLSNTVNYLTSQPESEIFDSLEYVTDTFINNVVTKLEQEDAEEPDEDTIDKIIVLTNIDKGFYKTHIVTSTLANKELSSSVEDYELYITELLEKEDVDLVKVSYEITAILYYCSTDLHKDYREYIEETILQNYDRLTVDTINSNVQKLFVKIKENTNG